ncbi:MAG: hypothetical protein ACREJV_04000, partial [Candidatus Rokuibacteriota bacterium]
VFTRTLLRGLEGHADANGDGLMTTAELAAWMHPRVAQASDYKQDMQWGSLDGEGQFVFVLPRRAPLVAPSPATPSSAPSPVSPAMKTGEGQIAALPPDLTLQPFAGTWEGWMSTRLSEALVGLSIVQRGAAGEATVLLSSARNRGSGMVGFDESYALLRRSAGPTPLFRISVAGRRLWGQDADGTLTLELDLSKDSRTLQGTIKADGTPYGVNLRRK